jgi:hypothetical protein
MTADRSRKIISFIIPFTLICISTLFYYYINSNIRNFHDWPSLKYTSGDSQTYFNVGQWLIGEKSFSEVKQSVAIRPFFYPLFVASLEKIHPWAIIIFQFILWETQILLAYFCGTLISKSPAASFIFSLFCATFLSPIGISLHVLSETLTSFLLTISLLFLIIYTEKHNNKFILIHIATLSLCSVVRPVYFYLFFLDASLCFFFLSMNKVKLLIILIVISTPVIFQISIMMIKFNINNVSFIDTLAFNDYYLSKIELYKRKIEKNENSAAQIHAIRNGRRMWLGDAIDKYGYKEARYFVNRELWKTITFFPYDSFRLFLDLILENSKQPSNFLASKNYITERRFFFISLAQSATLRMLNLSSLLLSLLIFISRKKQYTNSYFVNMFLFLSIYMVYISNGVSFWQGDRLIVPVYFISAIWFFYQINMVRNILLPCRKL